MGKIPAAASEATIIADLPGGGIKPDRIADIALGVRLRGYAFERYKTKRKEGEERAAEVKVTVAVAGVAAVEKAFARARGGGERRAASRAISSTSRPTCCSRRSSPAAPAI